MDQTYEFTLILKTPCELDEAVADALFAAGCDDGSPGMCDGVITIDFHRDSASLEQAISSAVTQVRSLGFEVRSAQVQVDDLMPVG